MNQDRYTIKRADLPTWLVLPAVKIHGSRTYEVLTAAGFPDKIVIRAFERDTARGLLDWGVSPARPFLTREGEQYLKR